MNSKKVLLIAGGGTLGQYVSAFLSENGHKTDVICLEDKVSDNNVCYYKANATEEYLNEFLKDKHYDAIVNFIHYVNVEDYKPIHKLLCSKTEQLVFLSSYRVYADAEHPVTENAPQLYDTVTEEQFLKTEDYAVPKSQCEKFIKEESGTSNWTIVRPVISFSQFRYDIVYPLSSEMLKENIQNKKPVTLPAICKNLTAGIDWAGNSGKLIANLLFKQKALGETFTVSTAQNLKWYQIAEIYTELCGINFEWLETEEYLKAVNSEKLPYFLKYDRFFDRVIDNRKILNVTGLKSDDFMSVKDGIKFELSKIL